MHPILELASRRPVLLDGAMGTEIVAASVPEADFGDLPGVLENLVITRPDLIAGIHRAYLQAGADIIETNTFGANAVVLAEHGAKSRTRALNLAAARLAKGVAAEFSTPESPRFVAGSVGPTAKLPTLNDISFAELLAAYHEQVLALLEGGVDAILIETCQDPLQARAACVAAVDAMDEVSVRVPIFCQFTFDPSGKTLLGTEAAAAVAAVASLPGVEVVGVNCSTGPDTMTPVVRSLLASSKLPVSAQPNAGMPEQDQDGRLVYRLTPEAFARQVAQFAVEGVAFVGGCCGTTPAHIAALRRMLGGVGATQIRPRPIAVVSSLFSAVSLRQEPRPFIIGERTNSNGSKEFRDHLTRGDWEGMVAVASDQAAEGAHALDVCLALPGRDEAADAIAFLSRLRRAVDLPLVYDSTNPTAIEAALQAWPGRAVVNSVNLEDGGSRLDQIARIARRYGAAIVALTIDESGMALTADRKFAVASRLVSLLADRYGFSPSDVVIDPLTFTLASGDTRGSAMATIEALSRIKAQIPGVFTSLGISNVSYGLKPAARRVLNSVFLHHCLAAGLDMAILNAGRVLPLGEVPEPVRLLAEDLIFARREDALSRFIAAFEEQRVAVPAQEQTRPEERLRQRVVRGERSGLEKDLEEALLSYEPIRLIGDFLLPAMRDVGDAFARGETQLPFVLRSAEVVKAAVALLRPQMDMTALKDRGTIVLATVAGDVHDVGKNLVDAVLSANGFRVINLGVKQPVDAVIAAAQRERADAIGLSGLLVRSCEVMRDDVIEMRRRGITLPVLLGGAALNARFVEDIRTVAGGDVVYCRDAAEALAAMERVLSGSLPRRVTSGGGPGMVVPLLEGRRVEPPFKGTRVVALDPSEVASLVNRVALFRGRWGYRKANPDWDRLVAEQLEPLFQERVARWTADGTIAPVAVYGLFEAHPEGDAIVLTAPDGRDLRFLFPRVDGRSYADAVPKSGGAVGAFVVTVGPKAASLGSDLFAAGDLTEYLYLQGIAAEMTEAAAELVHRRVRDALGLAPERRGRRVSFGYAGCPGLEGQPPLLDLLGADRIGVTLTEGLQMVPEYSVSAFVLPI